MRRTSCAAAAAMLVAVGTGCGGGDGGDEKRAEPETFTARGEIELVDSGIIGVGGGQCVGMGGYSDMAGGTQVVVRDGDGTKVAIGELDPGTWGDSHVQCVFSFTVEDIPTGGGVYSVEVSHRGEVSFKQSDADSLSFSLGS